MANAKVKGSGTRQSPWVLKTPPGTSEFEAYQLRGLEAMGLAEVEHNPKNNRMRAR
ncbi:MAG TPA: hypothetical protein VF990_06250 [Candidatus Dormibacteraeota bacterium]